VLFHQHLFKYNTKPFNYTNQLVWQSDFQRTIVIPSEQIK